MMYELGQPQHDIPRFEGDTILCGTAYDVLLDGEIVACIYEHPTRYEGARAFVSLNKIRWSGKLPSNCLSRDAYLFHDFVSDFTTAQETLPETIRRCERIREWRKNQLA